MFTPGAEPACGDTITPLQPGPTPKDPAAPQEPGVEGELAIDDLESSVYFNDEVMTSIRISPPFQQK